MQGLRVALAYAVFLTKFHFGTAIATYAKLREATEAIVMKPINLVAIAALSLVFGCTSSEGTLENTPAAQSEITHGELDGEAHPAVVLLLMEVKGVPTWRCSGTLLNATTVLTAGHCTDEPGVVSGIRAFTESDVQHGNNNYPNAGPNAVEAVSWASHPEFKSATFFLHDVGIVKLAPPGVVLPASAYGVLPKENELEALKPSAHAVFTAVGYGRQRINPAQTVSEKIRMRAEPHLVQINTPGLTGNYSLLLSNNAATGGTCFGDSGGPDFLGSSMVVAGVTSFGMNGTCGGTGGVFRMDRKDVLEFVGKYLP